MNDAVEFLCMRHEKIDDNTKVNKMSNNRNNCFNINEVSKKELCKKTTATNSSSIAVIIEFNKKKLLFLGDSDSFVIEKAIDQYENNGNSLEFDLIKVPHHGSNSNMSLTLIEKLNTDRYLISTDGKFYKHPDKELILKLINKSKLIMPI